MAQQLTRFHRLQSLQQTFRGQYQQRFHRNSMKEQQDAQARSGQRLMESMPQSSQPPIALKWTKVGSANRCI